MAAIPKFSRRGRWVVPAGVVAAVAAVGMASAITVAQAAPALPSRTPAQLLAAIAGDTGNIPPLTGTVVETASLGIPQLPGAENPSSLTSLLAGSHTLKIWYDGPKRLRLAAPVTLGETDLIRNGTTAWLWQSGNDSVTKFVLPAGHGKQALREKQAREPAMPHALTPQQAAQQALKIAGRSTRVTTEANVVVAGQDAYQLVLAPRSSGSQIARITIALDAQHLNVALRVRVFAKGQAAPAFQVGYTSISFVTPAASNFDFTPPPGARVKTESLGTPGGSAASGQMPKGKASGMQVLGKDWTSVAVLPEADVLPGPLTGVGSASSAAGVAGQAAKSVSGGGGTISGSAVLGAMFLAAHPVHGAWGSGKLLHTALVSMLITNGHVLIGAVTPSVLYADAAHVK
jgi:outer membrane lipoprotein-sorting protein